MKILIIDEDRSVQDKISEIVKAEGFQSITADNAHTGLQLAHEQLPDLIICDLMTQEFDGFQLLKTLRQDTQISSLPFILLTAKAQPADLRKGMNLGADDYLTKPFTPNILLESITARLKKHATLLEPYASERQRCEELKEENQQLQHYTQIKGELQETFSQKLRESVSSMSMAVRLLKTASTETQRDNYLQVLHQECDQIVELLNQLSLLDKILLPDNIKLLDSFNLLKKP